MDKWPVKICPTAENVSQNKFLFLTHQTAQLRQPVYDISDERVMAFIIIYQGKPPESINSTFGEKCFFWNPAKSQSGSRPEDVRRVEVSAKILVRLLGMSDPQGPRDVRGRSHEATP